MSEVIRDSMEFLQEESDEFISKKFSSDVFNNYQSLVKGSERISTGIFGSLAEAQIAVGGLSPQDAWKANFANQAIVNPKNVLQPRRINAATRAGKMSESTLQGTMDAASMAIKVMRGRL
jgi:hypothetical protein